MNFFDNSGQINASSMKELASNLAKYAQILGENTPSSNSLVGGLGAGLSDAQQDELVNRAIYNNDAKIALAQAMANPIRKNLDYSGMARRALVVDPLN